MKKVSLFIMTAVTLLMISCNNQPAPDDNHLIGPINSSISEEGKLIVEYTGEPFVAEIEFISNGRVFYNGVMEGEGNERIFTISEPKVRVNDNNTDSVYSFTLTVNTAIDENDATVKLTFAVDYSFKEANYEAAKLIVVRKGKPLNVPKGAIKGLFSIGEGRQVHFAQGNLRYDTLLNQFSFAEKQYATIGSTGVTLHLNVIPPVDQASLFPWTWMKNGYQYCVAADFSHVQIVNAAENNENNSSEQWFVPSAPDWKYLLKQRPNADKLVFTYYISDTDISFAEYPCKEGAVILPDNFVAYAEENNLIIPSGVSTFAELKELENYGALILPAEGMLVSEEIHPGGDNNTVNIFGAYWSSTYEGNDAIGAESALALTIFDPNADMFSLTSVKKTYPFSHEHVAVRLARFPSQQNF